MRSAWAVALAVTVLGACATPEQRGQSVALAAVGANPSGDGSDSGVSAEANTLPPSLPDPVLAVTTPPAAGIAQSVSVPLEIVRGTFLGVGTGSFLVDALPVLGVTPVLERQPMQRTSRGADTCANPRGDHWVMRADGLTLVFAGPSASTAQLTSWQYIGGPAVGFTEMVAPGGVAVGGLRRDVLSAYDQARDLGSTIEVGEPVNLRFGLRGDSIVWIGSGCSS